MIAGDDSGFRLGLRRFGRSLKNLRTNVSFIATVNRVGSLTMDGLVDADSRADAVMELTKSGAPDIGSQDRIADVMSGEKWVVVKIKFDCPPYAKRFELRELTGADV